MHRDYRNNNIRCRRGKNSCGCDIGLYNQTSCNKFKEKLLLFLLNIAYFESYIVQLGTGCVVKLISTDTTLLALCLRLNVTCTCDSFTSKTVIIDNWPQRRISLQRNPAFCMIKFRNKERSRASSFILCYIIHPRLDTCASWYASISEFLQRLCLLCMLKDALNFVPSTCEKRHSTLRYSNNNIIINEIYSETSSSFDCSTPTLRIPFLNNGLPLSCPNTRLLSWIFSGLPLLQHNICTSSFKIFSLYASNSIFNLSQKKSI